MSARAIRASSPQSTAELYISGEYARRNPAWHVGESSWKAKQIIKMFLKHSLKPKRICDIGCGAGEVLRQLQGLLGNECVFEGYDISPGAIAMCLPKANERLHFTLGDGPAIAQDSFDLVLVLDVIEHLEDYFGFLRRLKGIGRYTMFHIPLDLSVQTVLRPHGLLKRRESHYHLHYFTKQTAVRMLEETGYEVADCMFTPRNLDLPGNMMQTLLKLPRRVGFAVSKELTVRLLGGFSLMVLAK